MKTARYQSKRQRVGKPVKTVVKTSRKPSIGSKGYKTGR